MSHRPLKPTFRPSLAETRRRNQTALDYYRALSPNSDAPQIDVGAKLKRTPPKTFRLTAQAPLERDVLRAVLQLLRAHPLVAWCSRINSGAAVDERGQFMRFHQIAGCSDIIGQMKTGHFLAIECKRPGERPTEPQMLFLRMVQQHGGCAGWCDSVAGCEAVLREWASR